MGGDDDSNGRQAIADFILPGSQTNANQPSECLLDALVRVTIGDARRGPISGSGRVDVLAAMKILGGGQGGVPDGQ